MGLSLGSRWLNLRLTMRGTSKNLKPGAKALHVSTESGSASVSRGRVPLKGLSGLGGGDRWHSC